MADYLNLESMRPGTGFKPTGMLGGYMWNQYQNDYERLLAQSEEQRRIALERARQEQSEFMRGIPLRYQTQDNATAAAQAVAPFAGPQASSAARADIGKNESFLRMIPTAETRQKHELSRDMSIEELRRTNAAETMAAHYLNQAIEIRNNRGVLSGEAQKFLFGRTAELRKAGYNIPAEWNDINKWDALYQSTIHNVQTTQELLKQAQKDDAAYARTDRSARATENAAAIAAQSRDRNNPANRPPKDDKDALRRLEAIIRDPESSAEEVAYAKAQKGPIVNRLWDEHYRSSGSMHIQDAHRKATNPKTPPAEREVAARQYRGYVNDFFQRNGISMEQGFLAPTPADATRAQAQKDYRGLWTK